MKFLLSLALILTLTLVWRHRQLEVAVEMQDQLASQANLTESYARAQEENRRLQVLQVSPGELEGLRTDHAAILRLRDFVGTLTPENPPVPEKARAPVEEPEITLPEFQARLSASEVYSQAERPRSGWQYRGYLNAADALETLFWAAREENLPEVTAHLDITEFARDQAREIFASLPDAQSIEQVSPEQMIAASFIEDVAPVSSIQIVEKRTGSFPNIIYIANLRLNSATQHGQAMSSKARFQLRLHPDGWHLEAPYAAVENLRQRLAAAEAE